MKHADIHADWMDSLADWAAENAAELKHFNPPRQMVTMQGRPEQGWPARRCSPETAHFIDRVREEYDADDQSQSADGVLWVYIATIGSVIAAAVLAVAA